VPGNVEKKLLAKLHSAAKTCKETPGQARLNCSSAEKNALVSSFNRGQHSRIKALPTFTHALTSSDPKLQALAAAVLYAAFRVHLGPDVKAGSVSPDEALALLKATLALPSTAAMQAMPATTHAMMLSGQSTALSQALTEDKSLQMRTMAYRFLMVYGRLSAFSWVQELAKAKQAGIVLAALESPKNMRQWTEEEQRAICPWAEPFLDDPRLPVAGNATAILANCTGASLDLLLGGVEKSVKGKDYSFVQATALREMCRKGTAAGAPRATEAQCRRARQLQEAAVKNSKLSGRVRALTLSALGSRWPDQQTLALAKRLTADAAPELKQAAKRVESRVASQLEKNSK
jgi:hypothetical protein